MSEETRVILVNSVSSSEYITITNDFRKLEEKIERLNKKLESLEKLNNANYKSFIETNNIINELEKWLVEWREMLDCPDFYEEGIIDCINDTLTKLQELKGSDKE